MDSTPTPTLPVRPAVTATAEFRRHIAFVRMLARRMAPAHQARDVAQDSLLAAWEHYEEFKGEDVKVWLRSIVRNRVYSHLRRRVTHTRAEPLLRQGGSTHDGVDERVCYSRQVRRALSRLPQLDRTMFVLKHVEGYTYEEIAEREQTTATAVKMRIHHAKNLLASERPDEKDVTP